MLVAGNPDRDDRPLLGVQESLAGCQKTPKNIKKSQPLSRRSGATGGEFAPVEAEIHDQQRGQGEGDHADSGEDIAQVAPVTRPQVEHAAGDEGKGDRVGSGHPLAVDGDLTVARGDESSGGAHHPGGGLHRGTGKPRAACCESDPREGPDKNRDDVDIAEDAMESGGDAGGSARRN